MDYELPKPTQLELDGLVNWERFAHFEKLNVRDFLTIPINQRCGAWRWINDARNAVLKGFSDGL